MNSVARSSGRARREREFFRPSKLVKPAALKKDKTKESPHQDTSSVVPPVRDVNGLAQQSSEGERDAVVEKLVWPLASIMRNLHGTDVGGVVGREQEQRVLVQFLESTVGMRQPGALYVSGRPGCGKTLSVRTVTDAYRRKCKVVMLNGMSLLNGARSLFSEILAILCPAALKEKLDAESSLRKMFIAGSDRRPTLLVLDELDSLLENHCEQSVLAALFSWTQLAGSKLVIIGIANALDFTHRFLPILHAKNCAPKLLTFTPYSEQHLLSILQQRLHVDSTFGHKPATQPPGVCVLTIV
jgi:Cdc6-like AAA superfamily ATPase